MSARFEELDWQQTPMGEVSLRRRRDPVVDRDVYEVQLNDEFLMSSLFTVAETELGRLGLAQLDRDDLHVLVGGLGLGYTAVAALEDPRVSTLTVVDAIEPVIDWHRRGLLPYTAGLTDDARVELVHDDFFDLVATGRTSRVYDVLLLDIDHTPDHVLHPSHRAFYSAAGLHRLEALLAEDGVFAMWSDDPPEPTFRAALEQVFGHVVAHVVTFPNPLTRGESSSTVYVARRRPRQ
ncbi:spermidine synthase [Nocardioides sp.]|uniref:spermidine synthase n=1 Tax=Nocardioides sp. TaxID=35761 RepID=UPI00273480D1|nr:spermidine synthase [Nocardioides sp.]MDP3891785.1 spermidine synthase [Nocardioides sp.]